MKTWIAILFTIGLFAACIVIHALIRFNITWIMVLGTALWAAIDSSKIQLKRYKSGISYGPVVLFIAIAFLWIVGFPWYLAMRYKIKTGTAVLKDGATNVAA
jgi:membrane protein YdbS with pleckstrin-like domain